MSIDMYEPREIIESDGQIYWRVFDIEEGNWCTSHNFGKYKTKNICQMAIRNTLGYVHLEKSYLLSADLVDSNWNKIYTITNSCSKYLDVVQKAKRKLITEIENGEYDYIELNDGKSILVSIKAYRKDTHELLWIDYHTW